MELCSLESHVDDAVATARRWARQSLNHSEPRAARLLADVLRHERGLRFTLDFVDQVLRPEDPRVAAHALRRLASEPAPFLPAPLRLGLEQVVGRGPRPLLPVVRRVFTAMVGDLVVDYGRSLGPTLKRLKADGASLNVNLLGEAVLGEEHAAARLKATQDLLSRPDVDYVSIKVSAVLGQHSVWGHEAAVAHAVERLRPLMRMAADSGKFVNLDMEEYRDLHLTLDVFERLLSEPELLRLHAGVAVQTYLRESALVLERIDAFAADRVSRGGAPVKVRLVKGANLAMERVQAELRGWELPIQPSKEATDASFLRALDLCLTPERAQRVRIGVASHNVYSLAMAWEVAKARGLTESLDFEMLSGMAVPLQRIILAEAGRLRLYVPVVPREEYDAAISYLVRRLEENAAPENFMSGAARLGSDTAFLDREESRFRAAARCQISSPSAWAEQHRSAPSQVFTNAADTDPALPSNQAWAEAIRSRLPAPEMGSATLAASRLESPTAVKDLVARAEAAGREWAAVPGAERAKMLRRLGAELEAARADLITVAADEAGKLIDQADIEVSEACDFAAYYASLAEATVAGAAQTPPAVTLIASPWNFPIAIPLGGVAAALAAGSAAILKPAPPARRTAALLAEACWRAGLNPNLVAFAVVDDGPLGQALITDDRVGQVVLTGAAETAELFRSWRPDLNLLAETSGKNAMIVTPSADLDLAAADLVASAFGHAGQKCSAASLGILVGSVAKSRRFLDQVLDAAASLKVGWPDDPSAEMGPLTEAPGEKLLRGLTDLGPGESWLLKPQRIDERLWTPGIRLGVVPGSEFHHVEYFGPVLGLMAADSLEQAIEWQNGTRFGLTAGLHSLDAAEVQTWLDTVEAGNVYVNRTITGAIVRRQPFGGWKRSVVGRTSKAGGPNYVAAFGGWEPTNTVPAGGEVTDPVLARLVRAADGLGGPGFTAIAASDEAVARSVFRASHDPSALRSEINALRYRPAPITVRVETLDAARALREACAAAAVGATPRFSLRDSAIDPRLLVVLAEAGFDVVQQSDEAFDRSVTGRVRYLGNRRISSTDIGVTIYDGPTLPASRIALLPYVREQAVCVTNHRFGHPSPLTPSLTI